MKVLTGKSTYRRCCYDWNVLAWSKFSTLVILVAVGYQRSSTAPQLLADSLVELQGWGWVVVTRTGRTDLLKGHWRRRRQRGENTLSIIIWNYETESQLHVHTHLHLQQDRFMQHCSTWLLSSSELVFKLSCWVWNPSRLQASLICCSRNYSLLESQLDVITHVMSHSFTNKVKQEFTDELCETRLTFFCLCCGLVAYVFSWLACKCSACRSKFVMTNLNQSRGISGSWSPRLCRLGCSSRFAWWCSWGWAESRRMDQDPNPGPCSTDPSLLISHSELRRTHRSTAHGSTQHELQRCPASCWGIQTDCRALHAESVTWHSKTAASTQTRHKSSKALKSQPPTSLRSDQTWDSEEVLQEQEQSLSMKLVHNIKQLSIINFRYKNIWFRSWTRIKADTTASQNFYVSVPS